MYVRLYHQAIVTTLVHPSWKLRKSGQVVAKRLVTSGNGLQVARSLLQELRAAMATQKVQLHCLSDCMLTIFITT